jgi:hypothetical protein
MVNKLLLAAAISLALSGCCHSPESPAADYKKISIEKLVKSPKKHLERRVEVTGQLRNAGSNYFNDLKLVLEDEAGRSLAVQPWLPLSVPPPRPGRDPGQRPRLISDYLGAIITIKGSWTSGDRGYLLKVDQAEAFPQPDE